MEWPAASGRCSVPAPQRSRARAFGRALLAAALVALASGCFSGGSAMAHGTLRAELLDTLTLQEKPTDYLGRPASYLLPIAGGHLLLAEQLTHRVYDFDRSGALVRLIGSAGDGPGEMRMLSGALATVDGMLVVDAYGQRRLHLFDMASGEWIGSIRYGGLLSGLSASGSTLVVGLLDAGARRAIVTLPAARLRALAAARDSSVTLRGSLLRLPPLLAAYPGLHLFDAAFAVQLHDMVVGTFGGSSSLVVMAPPDSDSQFEIALPARRRKGLSPDSLRLFRERGGDADALLSRQASSISGTSGLFVLPNGNLLTWHQDLDLRYREGRVEASREAAYLSIVRGDLSAACVDAEILAPGSDRPRIGVLGDTVYVLDQSTSAAGEQVRSVVRRYLLRTSACDWIPLARTPLPEGP